MGKKTKIDWCDSTWNPVTGCLHGCEYCYARRIAERFGGHDGFGCEEDQEACDLACNVMRALLDGKLAQVKDGKIYCTVTHTLSIPKRKKEE